MLIPRIQNIRKLCAAAKPTFYVTTPIFYVNAGEFCNPQHKSN